VPGVKKIAEQMGRTQKDIKERWKIIDPAAAGDGGNDDSKAKNGGNGGNGDKKDKGKDGGDKKEEKGDEAKEDEKKPEEPQKLTKAQKKAAKNEAKQQKSDGDGAAGAKADANKPAHKPPSKAPSKAGSKAGSEARFTMGEWMTLREDDLFSFGELQLLSELLNRDETIRWDRIASQFYDKTGRRVHKDDIREKFEGIGGMT